MQKTEIQLLIIGGGPAGLAAAIYAARSALDFMVMEKFIAGGQIVTTEVIENYPGFKGNISGYDLMQEILEHCKKFDIKIRESANIEAIELINKKKNLFLCRGSDIEILAQSLIIATGASPRRLFVEGENEFIGKGISYCATCDGPLYKDREVIVAGGGNTAIQESLFLAKFAKKVYVVHRRDKLRAVKSLQDKALSNPRIEFIWDSVIEKFSGSERLEEVLLTNVKNGAKKELKIDGVFEYIGIKPNNDTVKDIAELDKDGFIVTDFNMETSVKGLFAAGDVRNTPLRQVITAVADGAVAATSADKYLNDFF